MSENLIQKENMFIWHIAYLPLAIPVYTIIILLAFVEVTDWVGKWNDNKIESLSELAERSDELTNKNILLDTAAFARDNERIQRDEQLDWQTITDKPAGFAAKFPNAEVKKSVEDNEGVHTTITYYADLKNKVNRNYAYSITCHQLPENASMTAVFEQTRQSLLKDDDATLLLDQDAQQDGYIARDLKIKVNSYQVMNVRIAYYRSSLYIIRVLSSIDDSNNASVDYFLNSFEPL